MTVRVSPETPVVVFVYARPDHTQRTIRSLAENQGAQDKDLIIFADGPRSERVAGRVREVREFVSTLADRQWFRSVQVRAHDENLGLARSVIWGVTDVLQTYDAVIVVEDDLQLAPDFLTFMDAALRFYARDETIWSISGFSPELPALASYDHSVYLAPRGSSWGWGTWRRGWELVDWGVKDYPAFEWALRRRWAFNRGGRDLAAMLDAQMDGRIDSWAVRWCYSQHLHGMHTVFPTVSKVRNTGLDGSGTHGVLEHRGGSDRHSMPVALEQAAPLTFERLAPDPAVLRDFARSFRRYNQCPAWSFGRHLAAKYARTGHKGSQ